MFLLMLIVTIYLYIKTGTITYLLEDDYDISTADVAKVSSNLNLIATVSLVLAEPVIGFLLDVLGRKLMIGIGIFICGLSLLLMTFGTQVYPYLLIFFLLLVLSSNPGYQAPLINDYIEPRSFGICQMINQFV